MICSCVLGFVSEFVKPPTMASMQHAVSSTPPLPVPTCALDHMPVADVALYDPPASKAPPLSVMLPTNPRCFFTALLPLSATYIRCRLLSCGMHNNESRATTGSLLREGRPGNDGKLGLFLDMFEITPQINRQGSFVVDAEGRQYAQVRKRTRMVKSSLRGLNFEGFGTCRLTIYLWFWTLLAQPCKTRAYDGPGTHGCIPKSVWSVAYMHMCGLNKRQGNACVGDRAAGRWRALVLVLFFSQHALSQSLRLGSFTRFLVCFSSGCGGDEYHSPSSRH